MRSPTWRGCVIQPAVFQPRMSCSPHSSVITAAMRALAAIGSAPSELPSRYTRPSGMWNSARVFAKSVMTRSSLCRIRYVTSGKIAAADGFADGAVEVGDLELPLRRKLLKADLVIAAASEKDHIVAELSLRDIGQVDAHEFRMRRTQQAGAASTHQDGSSFRHAAGKAVGPAERNKANAHPWTTVDERGWHHVADVVEGFDHHEAAAQPHQG